MNNVPETQLVATVRKKFDKLEETCTERYQARERRVISTLEFCMRSLEQLQNWALFAIFPEDEENSDKYLGFVEQRFKCVVTPMRLFQTALDRERGTIPQTPSGRPISPSSPRAGAQVSKPSPPESPRYSLNFQQPPKFLDNFSGVTARGSSSSTDTGRESPTELSSKASVTSPESSSDSGVFGELLHGSLREKIPSMSEQYIKEGQGLRKQVLQKLQKCRKDMRTIYRWGQASLTDLHEVLDDSLSDELYFLVRGKMQRILSAISTLEEAAEQIEKKLSLYFQNQQQPSDITSEAGFEVQDFLVNSSGKESPRYESMDLRLNLDELLGSGQVTPRLGRGDEGMDSGESTRGSTPEPPLSPRPKGLFNHPKIMKDKLQNYALPSKFSALRLSTPW